MQQMESDALQPILFFFTSWIMYIQRSLCLCLDRIYFGVVLTMGFYQFDLGQGKTWRCSRLSPNTIIPERGNKKYSEELIVMINVTHMQLYLQSSKTVIKRALSMALANQI